uniref:Uncharacterized protein n=1 Tax=Chromera velia CCMP2878 TaxID=1169474 RepID=A0A0G4HQW0_9ALVE|eukprot:Cvel_30363.t1-p1 / transcript=Cvel_30363.t1 / gene=Cvel_30363 / organism=Chromera_velia_CCMP2878 / gene_product=hypothetical protein / transcript_product=hypothetical protein / location=Cvel_scaffold4317:1707-3289(+) / protein_length=242 / sequence_SO=supercontig / SO=protein_coding / is_pseudo=false
MFSPTDPLPYGGWSPYMVGDFAVASTCSTQWGLEFFLPLQSFALLKGISGGACLLSGIAWATMRFLIYGELVEPEQRQAQDQLWMLSVTACMGFHIVSVSYIRGVQQHRENERRRAEAATLQQKKSHGREENSKGANGEKEGAEKSDDERHVARPKKVPCYSRVFSRLMAVLSTSRARTVPHCTALVFVKLFFDFLDVVTDLAFGFLLILYTPKTVLPQRTRWGELEEGVHKGGTGVKSIKR